MQTLNKFMLRHLRPKKVQRPEKILKDAVLFLGQRCFKTNLLRICNLFCLLTGL